MTVPFFLDLNIIQFTKRYNIKDLYESLSVCIYVVRE